MLRSLPVLAIGAALMVVACTSPESETAPRELAVATQQKGNAVDDIDTARPLGPPALPRTARNVPGQFGLPLPPANSVHVGRLISVYGRAGDRGKRVLFAENVFVSPKWEDRVRADVAMMRCNPDSLQKRVLIDAPCDSAEFAHVMARMTETTVSLPVSQVGNAPAVIPRNAAFRVTFATEAEAKLAATQDRIKLLVDGKELSGPVQVLLSGCSILINPSVRGTPALLLGSNGGCLPLATVTLAIGDAADGFRREFEARGWLTDREPPRIVGSMSVHLEHVGKPRAGSRMLTLFMGDIQHNLDAGDVLRLHHPTTGKPLAAVEVVEDVVAPGAGVDRVHVRVRAGLDAHADDWLEQLEVSKLPGFPRDNRAARDAFVRKNGAKVVIRALFDREAGDQPSNFVKVSSQVVRDTDGNRKNVSPGANYELEFSQPLDLGTLGHIRLATAAKDMQVPARVLELDCTTYRIEPPLGLSMTEATRVGILARRRSPDLWRPNFRLEVAGGPKGVRSAHGKPLPHALRFGFSLDPTAPDNFVGWRMN